MPLSPGYHHGNDCARGSYSSTREPRGEPMLSKMSMWPLSRNDGSCCARQMPRAAHTILPLSGSSTARASRWRGEISNCPALNCGNFDALLVVKTFTVLVWNTSPRRRSSKIGVVVTPGGAGGDACPYIFERSNMHR